MGFSLISEVIQNRDRQMLVYAMLVYQPPKFFDPVVRLLDPTR